MTVSKSLKTIKKIAMTKVNKKVNMLKKLYKELGDDAKKAFLSEAQQLTGRSEKTLYRYINGDNKPSLADQKIIADLLNKEVVELFKS